MIDSRGLEHHVELKLGLHPAGRSITITIIVIIIITTIINITITNITNYSC